MASLKKLLKESQRQMRVPDGKDRCDSLMVGAGLGEQGAGPPRTGIPLSPDVKPDPGPDINQTLSGLDIAAIVFGSPDVGTEEDCKKLGEVVAKLNGAMTKKRVAKEKVKTAAAVAAEIGHAAMAQRRECSQAFPSHFTVEDRIREMLARTARTKQDRKKLEATAAAMVIAEREAAEKSTNTLSPCEFQPHVSSIPPSTATRVPSPINHVGREVSTTRVPEKEREREHSKFDPSNR